MSRRSERVNHLLRQELSLLLAQRTNDPRLSVMVTVTGVDTSEDLRYATVFISVMGSPEEKEAALQGIRSAAGYLRRELAQRIALKHIPELRFLLDQSYERGAHLLEVMRRLSHEEQSPS